MLHGPDKGGRLLSFHRAKTNWQPRLQSFRVRGSNKYVVPWHCQPSLGQGSVNHTPERWAVSCVAQHCSWGGVGESYHSHHSSPLLLPSLGTCGCLRIAFWGHLRFSSLCRSSMPPTQEALANFKLCRLCSGTQHRREITYLKLRCPSLLKTLCSERAAASKLLLTFATNVII